MDHARRILAKHGRSGLSRLTLGSVTEEVVRRANVPVLTVRVGTVPRVRAKFRSGTTRRSN
jgi:Universal stress protein family